MFSLIKSETNVGLSLSIYRSKALPEQNVNTGCLKKIALFWGTVHCSFAV